MSNESIVLEMVVIEPVTVMEAFTTGQSLDFAIEQVRAVVDSFEHDLTTAAGRKRTASFAAKIPKVKIALDNMGKDLTTEWKEKSKKVDGSRKSWRESMDALKVEARKPLTEWEEEQERAKAEAEAAEAAEKLAAQIESDHEIALLMNEKLDRDKADAKAAAAAEAKANAEFEERLRQERETRIAAEAAEKATRLANEKAANDKEEAEREKVAAANRIKAMEAAERRAEYDKKQALEYAEAEKVKAVKDAEAKAAAEAIDKENTRLAEEARVKAEQEAREADKNHRRKINREVLASLEATGMDSTIAKRIIKLIASGKIPHTQINY